MLELAGGKAQLKVDPALKMRRDFQRFDAAWTRRLTTALRARLLPEIDKCFGFRATTGFEDGLRRTIEWYRAERGRQGA